MVFRYHFSQGENIIYIDQRQYVSTKLCQYDIEEWGCATPFEKDFKIMLDNDDGPQYTVFPYRSAGGSLIHLMRST